MTTATAPRVSRTLLTRAYLDKRQPVLGHQTQRDLCFWAAWETVRDFYANDTARLLADGRDGMARESAASYSLAAARADRWRARYARYARSARGLR